MIIIIYCETYKNEIPTQVTEAGITLPLLHDILHIEKVNLSRVADWQFW